MRYTPRKTVRLVFDNTLLGFQGTVNIDDTRTRGSSKAKTRLSNDNRSGIDSEASTGSNLWSNSNFPCILVAQTHSREKGREKIGNDVEMF
jgi:hypothetical protein